MSLAYSAPPSQLFPWEPESTVRANLAIGELRQTLIKRSNGANAHAATLRCSRSPPIARRSKRGRC